MTRAAESNRRERILDAAEQCFAEFGFAGASLRAIVERAEVNLATVYYYFRSKSGLMEEVLKRRFGPLRAEHLRLLRQYEAEAGGHPLGVEKVLEAMLRPPLRLAMGQSAQREVVTRLIGRIVAEPNPKMQEILRAQRAEVRAALLKALSASLPQLGIAELQCRTELFWGALAFLLCNPRKLAHETRGKFDLADGETVIAELLSFFSAAFRAPAARAASPSARRKASRNSPKVPDP